MTAGATLRSLFVALLFIALPSTATALEKVTLQFNWKHQFQFAGYYAALEQGYFRAAGFDVVLRQLPDGGDPVAAVLGGQADFGVAASELALHRGQGKPVVALAVIVQHSPLVLLANRKRVPTIEALTDSRIMLLPHETELLAYLKRQGVARHTALPHSFNPNDLIEGRVDAISGYSTDEPFLLRQQGFPYVAFSPKEAGIDFYGDTLFTTAARVQTRPASVAAFRAAALRGWVYAMEHPEEIADLIIRRYGKRHSREHLLFEAAEMRRLMQPDLVDIGQMTDARWQRIGMTYAEVGMLPADFSLAGLVWSQEQRRLPAWAWTALVLTGLLLLMVTTSAAHYARLSRRLTAEMKSRAAAEAALRNSEERYRRLAEQSQDVIWTVDLETLTYTYVSPAVESARGYTPEEVIGQSIADSLSPESCERVMTMLADHRQRLAAGDATAISGMAEIEQWHKDGSLVTAEVMASFLLDDAGQPVAVLGISRSNAERRAAEAQLRAINERLRQQLDEIQQLQAALQEQAVRDSLTGCFNRRYLDETLERELWRARREGYPLAVVILDLDHFKQINDTYGHLAGDEVLRVLAERLRDDIRHEDVLCRYGGEEFVILMPRMPLVIAAERAERWRASIAAIRVRFGSFELRFTSSAGVAAYPDHARMPDDLMQCADVALYQAKDAGRNRVVVFAQQPPV
ncbi:MAG: PAS domain S-box protein [Betaproteobacteria bacterium HGW-Betaproteobacteria-7]|jgi:diguanylate cyclase (GGDEF)-like protein/PAS domain S-box-containing protein|nr:MAG: PAS domain S-box protein [Betaproteobacteria bacterium HGW-Betaproteobacteria-7]